MEFFNNKRLLVILSGITCILIALVIFVVSLIGFGNIGAFLGGKPAVTEVPAGNETPTNVPTNTPTVMPTQTPNYFYTEDPYGTTPPVTMTPETTTPDVTETPTNPVTEEPTPTPTDVPVNTITIVQGEEYAMTIGQTVQLKVNILPENATNKTVTWENSSGTNVAMVNANGMVAALSEGTAYIKASAGGKFTQIKITVKAATVPVDGVTFEGDENISLDVGQSTELKYNISPSNATETKVTWESSDNNVVTVVNGQITAVSPGTATVKVTVGGKTDTVTIEVKALATPTPEPTPEPTPDDPIESTDPTEDPTTVEEPAA